MNKTKLQSSLTDSNKSGLQKYQETVIGQYGLGKLFVHELLTTIFGPLPGATGIILRKSLYRYYLGRVGRNVIFGKSITIRHPHKIIIGDNVIIDDYAVLDAKGEVNAGIKIGNNVMIGRNSSISCKNGNITIGDNTNIAMNCFIQSAREVTIGKNVLFSAYCYVIGGGDHKMDRTDIPIISQDQIVTGIKIEDNCLIGAGAMIQDGVTIGRDSVIGTNAVVRTEIPPYSIAVGVPAIVKKQRR